MKSGLEGRNNAPHAGARGTMAIVSMKSGLEGRNNPPARRHVLQVQTGSQ